MRQKFSICLEEYDNVRTIRKKVKEIDKSFFALSTLVPFKDLIDFLSPLNGDVSDSPLNVS